MPNTPLGITYPDSAGHTRLWEHLQALAEDTDALLADSVVGRAAECWYNGAGTTLTSGVAFRVPVSVQTSRGAGLTVSSGGRLAIPVTGLWQVAGFCRAAGAVGRVAVELRANAAGSGSGGTQLRSQTTMVNTVTANSPDCLLLPGLVEMTAGDYLELFITSNAAGIDIISPNASSLTGFSAQLVGT